MADCWICRGVAEKWTRPEARLCETCWSRSVDGLRAIDFGIIREDSEHTLTVEAPPPHAPIITLAFRAESYGTIVKKLIKRELQIGRESIDEKVYFEVANEHDLPYLRGHEASELMGTLSEIGAVEISNNTAVVQIADKSADKDEVAMLTASLLHFLRARQNLVSGS